VWDGIRLIYVDLFSKIDATNVYFLYTTSRIGKLNETDNKRIHIKKTGIALQNNTLRILWEQLVLPFYSLNDRLDLFSLY
jgi:hypothetical protein